VRKKEDTDCATFVQVGARYLRTVDLRAAMQAIIEHF